MTAWTATSEKRYLHRILNRLHSPGNPGRFTSVVISQPDSLLLALQICRGANRACQSRIFENLYKLPDC
ncbi:TPA: hypothetical protein HL460_19625 [Escherichia coli]|nr:hypothetical protein [Escherichia coli]